MARPTYPHIGRRLMNRPQVPTPLQQEIWDSRLGLRDRLCSHYALFVHETEHKTIEKIALSALEARNPGSGPHDELIAALGYSERKMVCLHPLGSFVAKSTRHGPFSLLAILPAAVPAELTLDWSYAGTWPLPDIIKTDEPHLTQQRKSSCRSSSAAARLQFWAISAPSTSMCLAAQGRTSFGGPCSRYLQTFRFIRSQARSTLRSKLSRCHEGPLTSKPAVGAAGSGHLQSVCVGLVSRHQGGSPPSGTVIPALAANSTPRTANQPKYR